METQHEFWQRIVRARYLRSKTIASFICFDGKKLHLNKGDIVRLRYSSRGIFVNAEGVTSILG
jgi:hypothetical protein